MKVFIRFSVYSTQMTLDQLVQNVDCQPTRVWSAGTLRGKTQIVEKNNGFMIESEYCDCDDLDAILNQFLKTLKINEDRLDSVLDKVGVLLRCIVYSESTPPIYFSSDTISCISGLNADFDIDLYV